MGRFLQRQRMSRVSAVVLISSALLLTGAQAKDYHCVLGTIVGVDAPDTQTDQDAQPMRLITTVRDETRYVPHQRCSWQIRLLDLRLQPRQLVLMPRTRPMGRLGAAVETAYHFSRTSCDSELFVQLRASDLNRTWRNGQSMPKAQLIVPVEKGSHVLLVSFTTGDAEPSESCERVELSIMVAKAGFCGRNMLLHRSSCHLISDTELAMPDLDGSGLRQAAFSDMEDVRNFMRANDLRVNEHPYKRPLDLTDPVRIGVFRCPPSMQAFYWKSRNGSCVAEPFNSTVTINFSSPAQISGSSSAQCASVRVGGSGDLELQFSDCNISMRSLVSFPEIPDQLAAAAEGEPCKLLSDSQAWCADQPVCSETSRFSDMPFFILLLAVVALSQH